jgi:thiol:disulfide interchange protein
MFKRVARILTLLAIGLHIQVAGNAQIKQPVKWYFSAIQANDQEALITFTASIENGWHIYSQYIDEGGPLPTTFNFNASDEYSLLDKVEETSDVVEKFDPNFSMPVTWFENTAVFTQRIKMNRPMSTVKGNIRFMACSDYECLTPQEKDFSVEVKMRRTENEKEEKAKGEATQKYLQKEQIEPPDDHIDTTQVKTGIVPSNELPNKITDTGEPVDESSIWAIFISGFLGGLAAILMPCIFPMIPFTVGLFSKRGTFSDGSVLISVFFGLSIIIIYVSLGLIITAIFGSDALNNISTNGVFNFLFFLLLIVFAASFLGAFDITLPHSWTNKVDALADRSGGLSVFFMATTLALVSFSCTGPIIGTLLVQAASEGNYFSPAIGMIGFSLALAMPFTLFSMFPKWLRALPKSGGWLNSVKVVLGFLELALALKFLSNVDLAYHWQWLDREVFLVLWIIIFGLLGFYLLGKIKLAHDTELDYVSPPRLFLAIVSLAFTLYMIPGLWGAPLKVIAAFLPPQQTQDFDLYSTSLIPAFLANEKHNASLDIEVKKYSDLFEAPHGLKAFFDFDEGIAYARKANKPVLLDFTGHACVNCRKMETTVWSDPGVLNLLRNNYVVIQLYVDDKTQLPEHEQITSAFSGKKIKTIGNKWSDFQAVSFNTNSQPYYVLLSSDGKQLASPQGADYDPIRFQDFLEKGIKAFEDTRQIY